MVRNVDSKTPCSAEAMREPPLPSNLPIVTTYFDASNLTARGFQNAQRLELPIRLHFSHPTDCNLGFEIKWHMGLLQATDDLMVVLPSIPVPIQAILSRFSGMIVFPHSMVFPLRQSELERLFELAGGGLKFRLSLNLIIGLLRPLAHPAIQNQDSPIPWVRIDTRRMSLTEDLTVEMLRRPTLRDEMQVDLAAWISRRRH